MKKILLLLFCYCISFAGMAETTKKIELKDLETIRPLSVMDMPTAYQVDKTVSIQLSEVSFYATVTVTNESGEQVYSTMCAGTDNIQIDLKDENAGNYILHLNIEGVEYTGDFTL